MPIEVRTHLLQTSQAVRLKKKMSLLTPPTDSTLRGESVSSIQKLAAAASDGSFPKRMKQSSLIRATENGQITTVTLAEMERVYKVEVEAVLYHHEPWIA